MTLIALQMLLGEYAKDPEIIIGLTYVSLFMLQQHTSGRLPGPCIGDMMR
jgi:hypothetical protein